LVARDLISRLVPEAYRRIGVALNAHRAMPGFSEGLMELTKKVEVKAFLDFSDSSSK
jgi:hypothetical protein